MQKRIPDPEIDAILTNIKTCFFMNNRDPKTNEYATKLFGTEIKVGATVNRGAMEAALDKGQMGSRAYTTSYSRASKYDAGEFAKLGTGEAITCFHPRHLKTMHERLQLDGTTIPELDGQDPATGLRCSQIFTLDRKKSALYAGSKAA
jgi:hypothetical protein